MARSPSKALASGEVQAQFAAPGAVPRFVAGDAFRKIAAEKNAAIAKVVKAAGLKVE